MALSRFSEFGEADLQKLLDNKDSNSTKKTVKASVCVFEQYLAVSEKMSQRRGEMRYEEVQKIMRNIAFLRDEIDQRFMRDLFMQEGLLDFDDFEKIDCVTPPTTAEKNVKFLELVCKSGENAYKVLLKALIDYGREDIIQKLESTRI